MDGSIDFDEVLLKPATATEFMRSVVRLTGMATDETGVTSDRAT